MARRKQTAPPKGAEKPQKNELEGELTDALEMTFPASDPLSIGQDSKEPQRPVGRRPAKIDPKLVERLAEEVDRKQREKEG